MLDSIKQQWKRANVLTRTISILVLIFIFQTVLFLSTSHYITSGIAKFFGLNNQFQLFSKKPWTIVTFMLFHKSVNHFVGNLIFLYFIGREFLNLFNSKQFLQVLIGGAISGAFIFLLATNFIPNYQGEAILLGISAGILALLITITIYRPQYNIYFTENAKVAIWIISAITLVYITLTSNRNSGGNFAHLGGVLFGVVFAYYLKGNLFQKNKNQLKTVHRSVIKTSKKFTKDEEAQINKILDKMNKSGYESLSTKEKLYLFKSGK